MQDARDVLSALAGETGFETFEETEEGLKGYVQQQLFDRESLDNQLAFFPFEDCSISYEIREAEDRDWNEQWEQEGFEPIIVKNIVIHDGRHLPSEELLSSLNVPSDALLYIEIDAHLAFGTGTHETTRMMVATLSEHQILGKRILDCGCGTGILAIASLKMGAAEAVGYDIDEWSADNARHNAVINQADDRFTSYLGDASVLSQIDGSFDIIVANINRNILLTDMKAFHEKMKDGAHLLLSGFYQDDIPLLLQEAQQLGLTLDSKKTEGDWACIDLCASK